MKHILVEKCGYCPYAEVLYHMNYTNWCDKARRSINKENRVALDMMPDWCPLENTVQCKQDNQDQYARMEDTLGWYLKHE